MAISTNTLEISPIHQGTITSRWRVNASTADASGCETIKAAPGSGYELVIRRLILSIGGSITVTLGAGEESNAVKRVVLGPMGGGAMTISMDFGDDTIVLDPNAALTVDASGSATVWIYVEGQTRVVDAAGIASSSPSTSISSSPSTSVSSSPSSSISASVSSSPSSSISASVSSSPSSSAS